MRKLKLIIGKWCVGLIKFFSRKAKIDLIGLAYIENGIMKSHSLVASGEVFFIETFLKKKIDTPNPTFFDVGANVGDYTNLLRKNFGTASIHSFEPNPNTFAKLNENCSAESHLINAGIGATKGTLQLYFDAQNRTSVQATSDRKVLEVIAKTENIEQIAISVNTLDDYCLSQNIDFIDLLKIDTEGFELEALKGARSLLEKKQIGMIQFEFNEINIVKRRFLKDFYEILPTYDFFRLDESRLIPLGEWKPKHEIFMFQNILAIQK